MKFNSYVVDHLKGIRFSNSLSVQIVAPSSPLQDRLSWLEAQVAGKTVIHLGCVDHLPLIEQKRATGEWLHERLCKKASRCIGIDISEEGVRYLTDTLGYDDIFRLDLLNDACSIIDSQSWDVIVLGEVLEHLDNPVQFLAALKQKYATKISLVLITVPNAFRWVNFSGSFRGVEKINTDHRYWFTPYTIAKVVTEAGMALDEFELVMAGSLPVSGIRASLRRWFYRKHPAFRDVLAVRARFPAN